MRLTIPRDFSALLEYRKLLEVLADESKAIVLFVKLMVHLGYEVESSGAAGFMSEEDDFIFQRTIPFQCDQPMTLLTACGLLKKVPGGWECPLFLYYNASLDPNWIPDDTDESWKTFRNGQAMMAKDAPSIAESLPAQSWYIDQARVTDDRMNKILMLVKTIDAILKTGKRSPSQFEPPLIQASNWVLTEYSDVEVSVILRRAFEVSRRKNLPPGFNRSTIVFLEKWEDAVKLLMPADGYVKWQRKIQHGDSQ